LAAAGNFLRAAARAASWAAAAQSEAMTFEQEARAACVSVCVFICGARNKELELV
jgi:hypothetical protein